MLRSNKNIKIFLNYFLGPVLFVWLSVSLYHQVRNQPDLGSTLQKIKLGFYSDTGWKVWAVLVLMVFNWGIEARKWQALLQPVQLISWWRAFKATLAGVTFAINTPNRIGEYGGRVWFVLPEHRLKAVSLTVAGSFSQLIITLIFGSGGLIYLLNVPGTATIALKDPSYVFWIRVLMYVTVAITVLMTVLYFRLNWLVKWIERMPGISRFVQHIVVLEELGVTVLLRVFGLSLMRYAVFVIQYILMLQVMQVEIRFDLAWWLVCVLLLILAIVPTIALAEIGLRGQVSKILFGMFSANTVGIVWAAVGIWFINLFVPALAGSLLILGIKIFKSR